MKNEEQPLGIDYKDGSIIFEQNAIAETMYVVLSGRVEVIKNRKGLITKLATLEEGDFFGEMSLFDNKPRSATVKALGDVRLLEISKDKLLKSIMADPALAFKMLEKMGSRIRRQDDRIMDCLDELKEAASHHEL